MMDTTERLAAVEEAYVADMKLFNATLNYLRVCLEENSLQEAMTIINITQLAIEHPRV